MKFIHNNKIFSLFSVICLLSNVSMASPNLPAGTTNASPSNPPSNNASMISPSDQPVPVQDDNPTNDVSSASSNSVSDTIDTSGNQTSGMDANDMTNNNNPNTNNSSTTGDQNNNSQDNSTQATNNQDQSNQANNSPQASTTPISKVGYSQQYKFPNSDKVKLISNH